MCRVDNGGFGIYQRPPMRRSRPLVRALGGDDEDAGDLLHVARSVALQRVVVKRPTWAGPLGSVPDLEYRGRAVRYDVYLTT